MFILPVDATGQLTSDGWIFSSTLSIPRSIVEIVVQYFQTPFDEEFLGIKKFKNDATQINVIYKEENIVEVAVSTSLPLAAISNLQVKIRGGASIYLPQKDSLISL